MNKTTWITYQLESFLLDDGVKYDKRDTEEDKDDAGSGENSFMAYGDYYDTFYDQEEERTLTLRKQASVTTLEWWMLYSAQTGPDHFQSACNYSVLSQETSHDDGHVRAVV